MCWSCVQINLLSVCGDGSKQPLNTKARSVPTEEKVVTHELNPSGHVKGRRRKKKLKERTRGGGGGEETEAKKQIEREADYVLKGKMSSTTTTVRAVKRNRVKYWAHAVHSQRATNSPPETERKDKARLKIHQRDGQISSSGQLAGRNSLFPPNNSSAWKDHPLSVRLMPLSFIATSFPLSLHHIRTHTHARTHTFNSSMNKLRSFSLFCSCHLSVRLSAHICTGRTHPFSPTLAVHWKERKQRNPHMNRSCVITSQLLPFHWLMWLLVLEVGFP